MVVAQRSERALLPTPLVVGWLLVSAALTIAQLILRDRSASVPYVVAVAVATAVAWMAVVRAPSRDRLLAALLAASVSLALVGGTVSALFGWRAGYDRSAFGGPFWLFSSLVLGAALVVLLRRDSRRRRRDIDGLLDAASVLVAGLMVVWPVAVEIIITDQTLSPAVRAIRGLYPVVDLAVLALVLRVLLRDRTTVAQLLTATAVLWLVTDIAYLSFSDLEQHTGLLNTGWLWGTNLIVLAMIVIPRLPEEPAPAEPELADAGIRRVLVAPQLAAARTAAAEQATPGRLLLALVPLVVPPLVQLLVVLRGQYEDLLLLTVPGAVVLLVLAYLRVMRLASSARHAWQELVSQQRYVSVLAANSSDAAVVLDADLRIAGRFPRLSAMAGRPGADLTGVDFLALVHAEDRERVAAVLRRSLSAPGRVFRVDLRVGDRHGRPQWLSARLVNQLEDPDVGGIVMNLHDVTDQKLLEEELSHRTFQDELTGLANRALVQDRLNHAWERREPRGNGPAVIMANLDSFHTVNDRYGHVTGDRVLRELGRRLTRVAGRGETVGRFGNDMFVVLVEEPTPSRSRLEATAARVLNVLREPLRLNGTSLSLTASVGIAEAAGVSRPINLLRNAEVAMYRAKAAGRNRWTAYQPGMRTEERERLEWEDAMRTALDRNDFHLVYQPIVELVGENVIGFEALLRWQHPTEGIIPSDRFIPLAEQTGLIVPIGRRVLREAVATAARWQQRLTNGPGPPPLVAVNVSARQLGDADLVPQVAEALAASALDPALLVLEVTETAVVQDPDAAAERLSELRRLGVRVAIDDFGSGQSSLRYLRHFPADMVKIERSFVQSIPERGEFPPVVKGVLDIARALGITVVAEGVEHEFQRARLRDEGCQLAQGYHFGKPTSAGEAWHLLIQARAGPPRPAGPEEPGPARPDGSRPTGSDRSEPAGGEERDEG